MSCDMGMAISNAGIGGRTSTGESIYTSGNDLGQGDRGTGKVNINWRVKDKVILI